MPARAHTASDDEPDLSPGVIKKMVGSIGFRWALGIIGTVGAAGLILGANAWAQSQASSAPAYVATKADVDTLKVAVQVLAKTSDEHTDQLKHYSDDLQRSQEIQGKIFEAIKGVSNDVHAVDVHVASVAAQVDAQASQISELRSDERASRK